MAAPPQELTALDVAHIVAEGIAAATSATATTKVPAPHSSFNFLNFDDTEDKWVAFSRSVTQPLEMPCFTPGSDTLLTTNANKTQSAQLRN